MRGGDPAWCRRPVQKLQRRQKARAKVERERQPHVAEAGKLMAKSLELAAKVDEELEAAFKSLRELDGLNTQLEAGAAPRRPGWDGRTDEKLADRERGRVRGDVGGFAATARSGSKLSVARRRNVTGAGSPPAGGAFAEAD